MTINDHACENAPPSHFARARVATSTPVVVCIYHDTLRVKPGERLSIPETLPTVSDGESE